MRPLDKIKLIHTFDTYAKIHEIFFLHFLHYFHFIFSSLLAQTEKYRVFRRYNIEQFNMCEWGFSTWNRNIYENDRKVVWMIEKEWLLRINRKSIKI